MKKKIVGIFISMLLITTALPVAGIILNDNLTTYEYKYYSGSEYEFVNNNYNWSITEVVSTESSDVSQYPYMDVESDGAVHVVWMDDTDYGSSGADKDIFYKYRLSSGNWSNVEIVSTESTSNSWFPSLTSEDEGIVHVVWYDLTNYGGSGSDSDIFYKYRSSGGVWSTTEVVSTESTDNSVHPSITVELDGTVHVAWRDYTDYGGSGLDYDIFYKQRSSSGIWGTTEVVSTESTNNSYDASINFDDAGTIHIVWVDSSDYGGSGQDYDIFYKQRLSSGNWTGTEVVSTECTKNSLSSTSAVEPEGTVHVAWYDNTDYGGSGPDLDIFYKSRSSDGSWGNIEVVSTESNGHSADPSLNFQNDGTIHIAWEDQTDYNGADTDEDIFYKQRSSSGIWSTTEVVSTESTEPSSNPTSAVESDGTVHIAWDDNTDYQGSDVEDDIFYKYRTVEENIPTIPILELIDIKGGILGFSVILKNFGGSTAYDIFWEMNVTKGFLLPKYDSGNISKLEPGEESKIKLKWMFGFGQSTIEFHCKYKMYVNASKTELDVDIKQEWQDFGLLFGHVFPESIQPKKEWMEIESFKYKDIGFEQYVELIFKDIETWHNVRILDSGTQEILYFGACPFENGLGILEEGWITKYDIENELAYWEVELVNGL